MISVQLTSILRLFFSRDRDRGYSLRSMNSLDLLTQQASTDLYVYSYINRVICEWNQIPNEIRSFSTVNSLKSRVTIYTFFADRQCSCNF